MKIEKLFLELLLEVSESTTYAFFFFRNDPLKRGEGNFMTENQISTQTQRQEGPLPSIHENGRTYMLI